jgi:hypothetical protein
MKPLDALQQTLAAEHAAVYVLGVVGGRVSVSAQPRLAEHVASAYTTHRGRRDQVVTMVRAAGGTPVAADVSYQLPTPCRTPAELEECERLVEERCAAIYADLVGSTARANRQWAIDVLADAAVRGLAFGGEPDAFPGVGEL